MQEKSLMSSAVTGVAASIFTPAIACCCSEVKTVTSTKDLLDDLEREVNQLKGLKEDVERNIDRAKWEGMQVKSQVKVWQDSVSALISEATKIQIKYKERFKLFESCSPNLWLRRKTSNSCEKLIDQAKKLKTERDSFNGVAEKLKPVHHFKRHTTATVGMESMFDQLKSLAENDNIGVIGIHGMGGIGKTELLAQFHNKLADLGDRLDVIIWIDVGTDDKVDKIQKAIGARLGLEWGYDKSQEQRRDILFKVLQSMSFVLILDNLWEKVDLQSVGVPVPRPGSKCKIILTSRIEEVCDLMDAKKIMVELLQKDHSWQLFEDKAGKELINSQPTIRLLAKKISDICCGLPLAILTVARTMASKTGANEWSHIHDILLHYPHQFQAITKHVLAPLKLSYDRLTDKRLRAFLLTFCLFPSNTKITTKVLQYYWKYDPDINIKCDKATVVYHLGRLRTLSFIKTTPDGFSMIRMHPMVRAMILWITNGSDDNEKGPWVANKCEDGLDDEKWTAARRIATHTSGLCTLPEAPNCPNLVLLRIERCSALQNIPDNFFSFMPCLRLLDLARLEIIELPKQISNLVSLKYLSLDYTKIKCLPIELAKLVNLKYLGLNYTLNLKTIPKGVLASLTNLEELYMAESFGKWKVGAEADGVDIKELEKLKYLDLLEITVESMEAFEKVKNTPKLNKCTTYIHSRGCQGFTSVVLTPTGWKSLASLYTIKLSKSSSLKEVIIDYRNNENTSIRSNVHELILDNFKNLSKIKIIRDPSSSWKGLVYLEVVHCSEIEQLFECEGGLLENAESTSHITIFPSLRYLKLQNLPKLNSISNQAFVFGSLETIMVNECPNLKKLNLVADRLEQIKFKKSSFDLLTWDDDTVKSSFESKLVEL